MKKILSFLLALNVIISTVVLPVSAEDYDVNLVTNFLTSNLIENGGFEDGFNGWTVSNPYGYMSVAETFVDDAEATISAINGRKTLYISTPANAEKENVSIGYLEQEVDATTNTNYVLNLSWYDAYSTYGSIKVYGDTVSAETCLGTVGNLFSGNGWYSSTCAFNSGENEKLIVRMEFVYRAGTTKYAIDNITLKAAGNTQTIGFENGYPEDLNIRGSQYVVSTEKAYEGTHSIKLTSGSSFHLANAAFALNPDRHYAVMFWYYIERGSLGASLKFAHENGWSGYTTSPIRNQTLNATGEWKRAIMTPADGVSGTGTNKFVEIAFQNTASDTVVYIDNIQCKYYDESVDSITITGKNSFEGSLSAKVKAYNYGYNFEDPVTYQWQRSEDKKVWSDIEGATDVDYKLTDEDALKYLRLKVNTSNRYSTSVVDSYYSKAAKIGDLKEVIITKFHVSPDGNDANKGTEKSPFKTLEGAKNHIKSLDFSKINEDITVIFHEGKYNFETSTVFTAEDSGAENINIVYKAADGEDVVFSGATEIPASKINTVTNEDVLSKLNSSVRGRLVSVKLTDCGIKQLPAMNTISLYNELYNGTEYLALYNNGKEQPLSSWPNGEDEYVSWVEATDKGDSLYTSGTKGGTFVYSGDRPSRWKTNISDIWVAGYPGYNYRYERNSVRSINAETKEITLATQTCFGLINKETKPWKAFNILEEIDMPGEWYINRNEMTLYYYMPSGHDRNLELSTLDEAFIKLDGTENVKFEGIRFEKSRKTAIETKNIKNVDITDCTFTDIGTDAIYMSGKTPSVTDSTIFKDAATNCTISGNVFYNIGGSTAIIYGGDIDTLTDGNVKFVNNYVFRSGTNIKNREVINVFGCGNTVSHNNISSSSFQAIRYYGNNHDISYNEIYNINKASDDAGAVYAGRNYVQRGSVVSYNFIHNSSAIRNVSRDATMGIYWDDSQAGQYAHHNIVVDVGIGAYACGQDNRLENNIFVDCSLNGIKFADTYEEVEERKNRETEQYNAIADKTLYHSEYDYLETGMKSWCFTKNYFNVVKNNITVSSGENEIYGGLFNNVSGNSQVDTCSDFSNPDNLDYRIVAGSAIAEKKDVLTTSYNLDNIGNETDKLNKNSSLARFTKYGASKEGDMVTLTWSNALGANQYRVVVATDSDMRHKLIDTVVDYNYLETEEIDNSTEYFWTVYAVNTSREYSGNWQCDDGVTELNIGKAVYDYENATNFSTENLIVNGGFEGGLEGWVADENGIFTVVENDFQGADDVTKPVVNGTKALRAAPNNGITAGYVYQEVDVTTNTNYVLNLSWFNLSAAKGSVKVYGDEVSEGNLLSTVGNLFGGEVWYSSTAAFNSAEYEKLIVRIDFSYQADNVYFCVDNITLKAAGNTQLIGFESGYPEDLNLRGLGYTVSTEKAYEGTHSIKLESGSGYQMATAAFALIPNRHYSVIFNYYIESGSLGVATKFAHENGWSGYTTSPVKTVSLADTGAWNRVIMTPGDGVSGTGTNNFIEIAFQNKSPDTVVYIDNIRCVYYDESVDSITIASENKDSGWLNAIVNAYNHGYNFADQVYHQWQISEDKLTWTDIVGADREDYLPTSSDVGKYLRVKVNTSNRYSATVIDTYYSKAIKIDEAVMDSVCTLTDSSGRKVNSLDEIMDGELNVGFSLKYLKDNELSVYSAVYDEDGRLLDADKVCKNAQANRIDDIEFTLSLPTDCDLSGFNLKNFAFSNMKSVMTK